MDGQVTAALIISGVSLLCVLFNIGLSIKISTQQNKLELKKTRIDLLEKRRIMLQQVQTKIMERALDIKDIDCSGSCDSIEFDIMHYFNEIFLLFLTIGHFFPNDLCNEVVKVKNEIFIGLGRNPKRIEESLYGRSLQAEAKISRNIQIHLREIEQQLQQLLK